MAHIRNVEVHVHDIRLAARIGAYPHEEGRRQTLRVAVTLELTSTPGDKLDETVDYAAIVAKAEALAERHIALIETFGRLLAAACLQETGVARATVIVEKPGALANGIARARIVMDRSALIADGVSSPAAELVPNGPPKSPHRIETGLSNALAAEHAYLEEKFCPDTKKRLDYDIERHIV